MVGGVVLFFAVKYFGGSSAAFKYNDRIVECQNKIIQKMFKLSDSFGRAQQTEMDAKLTELQEQIAESLALVSKMEDFKGSTRLRDAAIALIEFYQDIVLNEYREIVDILGKGSGNFTEYERDRMLQIQNSISEREKPLDNELQAAQQEMAQRYNFKIQENQYQKQIDGK